MIGKITRSTVLVSSYLPGFEDFVPQYLACLTNIRLWAIA